MGLAVENSPPDREWQWNQLLDYIEAGLVVPVVGRELLWTDIDGERRYVPAYLARKFCARSSVTWGEDLDDDADPLGSVVQRFLSNNSRNRSWPYTFVSQLTRELESTPPPAAFIKLAQIPFALFVSTTSDTYLERAINAVRFDGRNETQVPAYGLASRVDLSDRMHSDIPVVFPLLGRANPSPDYALTDEDVLEFVHRFQVTDTPRRLFQTLRQRHVLLLGSGFSDWLTRFFVRQTRPDRLWTSTTTRLTHFIADHCVTEDERLTTFLQHPLTDAEVFPVTRAEQFVEELHTRWTMRNPTGAGGGPTSSASRDVATSQAGGVFLSYASDDYDAACRIKDTLDRAGLDVWFDRRDLTAGDEFERKITAQIAKSYLFIAVVSQHSLTPKPRFFRLEWREAETRAKFAAFNLPFVLPVAVDDTSELDDRLPEFVRRVQWTRAPNGVLPPEFMTSVLEAYQDVQRPSTRA